MFNEEVTDKEIEERLELLKKISSWPWSDKGRAGIYSVDDWLLSAINMDSSLNDVTFTATAPLFEHRLINTLKSLRDRAEDLQLRLLYYLGQANDAQNIAYDLLQAIKLINNIPLTGRSGQTNFGAMDQTREITDAILEEYIITPGVVCRRHEEEKPF